MSASMHIELSQHLLRELFVLSSKLQADNNKVSHGWKQKRCVPVRRGHTVQMLQGLSIVKPPSESF